MERKAFIRILGLTILLPVFWLWKKLTLQQEKVLHDTASPRVLKNIAGGVNFFDDYLVSRFDGKTQVFSSRCSHAGCKITRAEGNIYVCPCHGSRYDAVNGQVIKGPSIENLRHLPFSVDAKTGNVIVD